MIQRCFFNDFLRGNQAPELIPVFCACDNIWADEIKKEKHGVTFQRASLLSSATTPAGSNSSGERKEGNPELIRFSLRSSHSSEPDGSVNRHDGHQNFVNGPAVGCERQV